MTLNYYHRLQLRLKIVEWKLEGKNNTEIVSLIKINSPVPDISEQIIDSLIKQAVCDLELSVSVDKERIKMIHAGIYEEVYKYFDSIQDDPGYESISVKGTNKAMFAKEKLLGMYQKPTLKISKKTEIIIKEEPRYDLNKLTLQQQQRYHFLIDKCTVKTTPQIASSI